jgi:hypothetical protein
MNFAGLAQLLMPIDGNNAAGDEHFAGAAAIADADQFKQLVEFDVFAGEAEGYGLHRRIISLRRMASPG